MNFIFCVRLKDGPPVDGDTWRCVKCSEVVTVTPATKEVMIKAGGLWRALCLPCAVLEYPDADQIEKVHPISAGQLGELAEQMKQNILEQLRKDGLLP